MAKSFELRLGTNTKNPLNGGISYKEETSLNLSQSPHNGLLNMCLDNGGTLTKRKGQEFIFNVSLGVGGITGLYQNFKDSVYFIHGGKMYKLVNDTATEIPLQSGTLSDNSSNFFVYNSVLYIQDGVRYMVYDETNNIVKDVEPYIPQVSINRKPDGSESTVNESWNMLGTGFKDSFNADGTSTVYKLSFDHLLADTVKITVSGVEKIENTDFTANRESGFVTFNVAPAQGTNSVLITAHKFFEKLQDNIKKCNKAIEFSNRIFITGNSDLPNFYFAGGLTEKNDASYFPQKYQYAIKGTDSKVTGFKVHQNKLIVFKEDLTCTVEAATGLDNSASFPISYLNTEIGCDMPGSIQLINNDIVFCNSYGGVYVIASTIIPGEKSILPISLNVNGDYNRNGILQYSKADLEKATSVDHDFKYYLCIQDKCFVLDYREGYTTREPERNKWFYYDNINASCFGVKDNELFYGRRDIGQLVRFIQGYNDFGLGIKAVWKSKLLDFSYPDWLKMVSDIRATFNNSTSVDSTIKVRYIAENGSFERDFIVPANVSWSWKTFRWDTFDWRVSLFDKTLREKVKVKKIAYFQLEFSNDTPNQSLAIKNLVINYSLIRKVK